MAFRFKKFTIEDDRSTFRIGTDSMILGAWSKPQASETILDIGTGCGVLSLMMAQKSPSRIDAIDLDPESVSQANENFNRSPWSGRLKAVATPLEEFAMKCGKSYDFIISNPPFFENQLKSTKEKVNIAKHDTGLSLVTLIHSIQQLLRPGGRFCLIYPYANKQFLYETIRRFGFYVSRQLNLIPKTGMPPGRILIECSRSSLEQTIIEKISILGEDGRFSKEYLDLTENFHDF